MYKLRSLKLFLLTIASTLTFMVPAVAVPVIVHAADSNIDQGLNCGANLDFSVNTDCPTSDTSGKTPEERVNGIVHLIINIFSIVVGLIAVIMIIIGGIKYITSGGESANVTSAKNTILYAIIGLIVVALAQILVRYVLNKVNSSSST